MIAERADETWWISAWERNGYRPDEFVHQEPAQNPFQACCLSKVTYHYISASQLRGVITYKKLRDSLCPFFLIKRTRSYQRFRPPPPPPLRSPPNPDRLS